MDRGAGLGTVDGRAIGSTDPPRSHPGNERRQLPVEDQQTETRGGAGQVGRPPTGNSPALGGGHYALSARPRCRRKEADQSSKRCTASRWSGKQPGIKLEARARKTRLTRLPRLKENTFSEG